MELSTEEVDHVTRQEVHIAGPILVTARWQIAHDSRQPFLTVMRSVRQSLKRHSAPSRHFAEDVVDPESMLESFTVATWSGYQRLPERTTVADEQVERDLLEAVGVELPELVAYRVLDLRDSRVEGG